MTESLPSGVLKVAEECKRLLDVHAVSMTLGGRQILHSAIDRLAALASPPTQATGALSEETAEPYAWFWSDGSESGVLTLRQDFERHQRDYPSMRFTPVWATPRVKRAALSSAKREAEPLTDAKVIAMNPYLNDEGRRALWLAAFRFAERHHGITAASQVEPEDKHG